MGKYDNMKDLDLTCEERLSVFGNQMMEELVTISGYGHIIKNAIDNNEVRGLPDDFQKWVATLIRAADNLYELRDVLIMQR